MVQSKGISHSRNSKFSKFLATAFSKQGGGDQYQQVARHSKNRNSGKEEIKISQMTGKPVKAFILARTCGSLEVQHIFV